MLSRLEAQTGVLLDRNLQADRRSHDRREGGGNQADRPELGVDESYSLDVQDGISSRFDFRSSSIATDLAT